MNLETFEVRNTTRKTAKRTALVLLAAAFLSLPLYGQQKTPGSDSAADQSTGDQAAADQAIPSAVMRKFEAMTKRIEQLEAELKSRTVAAEASPAAGTPARVAEASSAAAPAEAVVAQTPGGSATAAPTKVEKIVPFSDWDWTWLNGNPRKSSE
jgi:hypothetical protein